MIAVFVLSVGMLGSTAMMLQGRAAAVNTNYDSKAMQMAQSIAEQMRANIEGVEAGNYNNLDTTSATAQGCISTGCTSSEMALYDEYIWDWMLKEYLPNSTGTGTVTGAGADSVFTVTIEWKETKKTSATTGTLAVKSYVMVFQP